MPVLSQSQLAELAAKYFPPEVVPKVLYIIQNESGGNSEIPGDGGAAYGLFQSHYIPPGTSIEQQFADAQRLYKADLANGGTGFGDWGEGRTYNGQPFGALGNNPYPGSISTVTKPPTSSSAFQTQLQSYLDAIDSANTALQKYLSEHPSSYYIPSNGTVGQYDAFGQAKIDPEGTNLAAAVKMASDKLDNFYTAVKNGLLQTGDPAAQAYLQSETAKAAEARKEYTDYTTRVNDLVALQDVPVAQQMKAAQALNAINTANKNRESQFSSLMTFQASPTTDTTPFASAIRNTIPSQAPAMQSVPSSAFAQAYPPPGSAPMPTSGLPGKPVNTPITTLPERETFSEQVHLPVPTGVPFRPPTNLFNFR